MSGKKAELIARVFATSELGISVYLTSVQRTLNRDEKLKLLKMPESLLPDPLLLKRCVVWGNRECAILTIQYF